MTKTIPHPPNSADTTNYESDDSAESSCASETENCDKLMDMNTEVSIAVNFLTCLLVKAQFNLESTTLFRFKLTTLLKRYYQGHWYPSDPLKGSGYRCLRVNAVVHPLLIEAAQICEMSLKLMRRAFPNELTVWVDPGDVSVRFGEHGSIGVLYRRLNVSCPMRSNYPSRIFNDNQTNFSSEEKSKKDFKFSSLRFDATPFSMADVKRQLKL